MKKEKSSLPNLNITWLGHSAFLLESLSGKSVLIDPWLDNPKPPSDAKHLASKAALILVTHGHSDHLGNTVEIAVRTGANVITIFEISLYLQSKGITTAQAMNKGGTMIIDGIKVSMVDAIHSSDIDAGGVVVPGGEASGFVIEFDNGYKVYHAGDTALFGDMKLIGQLYKPDVAILPIGDLYTMGPREAAMACKLINPRYIIGMHYGTFPVLTGTPNALRKYLPQPLKKRLRELEPGKVIGLS